ncbi:RHS repeat-associated core domain-containing protein, partial [Galbibacter sp. EGI 63066]|nr:RHS repeat-associated core domain-containing protein [Galbibacter sp. EGI 63066]
ALNRITDAQFAGGGWYDRYSLHNVAYDKNGNIKALQRKGKVGSSYDTMDDLTYNYYNGGNFLVRVNDGSGNPEGFKDGANTDNDYGRDANGNTIRDRNKGITGIVYNHLNLPTSIAISGGNISYIYDASGTKLRKKVNEGGAVTKTTDYAGNYIYEDDHTGSGSVLQFLAHV